jgi:hypothetical protein
MTHYLTALTEAKFVHEHRAEMDRQALFDAVASLGEWGLFSARSISKITGVDVRTVLKISPKPVRTGGRFDPESLPHLIQLIHLRERGELDIFEARKAVQKTSTYFASRATGIPRSSLLRWAEQAEALVAA